MPIADLRLPIANWPQRSKLNENQQAAIGNVTATGYRLVVLTPTNRQLALAPSPSIANRPGH